MSFEKSYEHNGILAEVTQAFRLTDKWSKDNHLNSVVMENIMRARIALQTALENISLTENEVEQRRRVKEQKQIEEREQKEEEEREVLRGAIDNLLQSFEQAEYPYKLTYSDANLISKALPQCLKGKKLTREAVNVLASLLREF